MRRRRISGRPWEGRSVMQRTRYALRRRTLCGPSRSRARRAAQERSELGAVADADVLARALARVDLARARDLLLLVLHHLQPLGDPARGAGDGEHDREHVDRKPQGLVDQARVEVDVGVQLALDEVLVLERDLLDLE